MTGRMCLVLGMGLGVGQSVAAEDTHNVQLGIIQRAGPMASPAPACCVIA